MVGVNSVATERQMAGEVFPDLCGGCRVVVNSAGKVLFSVRWNVPSLRALDASVS